jgi:DNA-binding GntR family transcriptional regulator
VTAPVKTRAEAVFLALRTDILTGRLLPGAKLPFAALTERYACSMSVTREALTRLAELGLVGNEPQLGFRVTPLSITDLQDLTTARVHIEGLALGYSIEHGDIAWEAAVVAAGHALSRTPQMQAEDPLAFNEDWTAAHAAFHASLLGACPNVRLRTIANELRDAGELYRRWTKPIAKDDARDTDGEHASLMDAVLARDKAGAVAQLERHLRRTADVLTSVGRSLDGETSTEGTRSTPTRVTAARSRAAS